MPHVEKERAESWSLEEVVERWTQLVKSDVLVDQWLRDPEGISAPVFEKVLEKIEIWRERLYGIDWFTRVVLTIAVRAAKPGVQKCSQHF